MQFTFSERMKDLNGTATREIFKLLSRPQIVSFAGGLPATEALPTAAVREIADELLSRPDGYTLLQYGTTEGYPPLVQEVIRLAEEFGITGISPRNVLILSGGQQGIDLMTKCLCNDGDTVLVEDPTYLAALQIFKSYRVRAVGVKAGDDGLDLADLEEKIRAFSPKLMYAVPTFSNPTGKTYGEANRKEIARITAKYGVPVLEDDPYARLRFSGKKVNALRSFAVEDNIVYQTSFSKILSPGLRVGAAIGPETLIRKMAIGKQGTDLHTSLLAQGIAAEYCRRGLLEPAIERSLPLYRTRKNAMMRGIARYMPEEFTHTDPEGGLFVWGAFAADIDTAALLSGAVQRNVAYIQGREFYADGGGAHTIRLNYSNASEEKIEEGMRALGDYFKEILGKKG